MSNIIPQIPVEIKPSLPAGTYQVTLQNKLYEITLSSSLRGVPQAKDCIELEGYSITGRIKRVFDATFDTCTTESVFENYTNYLLETPTTETLTLTPVATSTAPILPTMAYTVTEPSPEYMMPLVSPQNGTFDVKTSADGTPVSVVIPTLRSVGVVSDEIVVSGGKAKQHVRTGYIASYNGETVGDTWVSSTGALTTGAEIVYQLSTPIETDISDTDLGRALLALSTGADYTRVYTSSDTDVLNDIVVGYNSARTALTGGEITVPCDDYPVLVVPVSGASIAVTGGNSATISTGLFSGDKIVRNFDGTVTHTQYSNVDPTLPLSEQTLLDTPIVTDISSTEEGQALAALKSTENTTTITTETPISVKVKVVG